MGTVNWLRLGILSVLWGGSFFFVEIALGELAPIMVVAGRVGMAALCLAGVLWAMGTAFPRGAKVWGALMVQGALNNILPFGLFAFAQGAITGGLASILNATTPLWTVLIAHVLTRDERLTLPRIAGVGLGLAGVVVLSGGGAGGEMPAILACLAAAFSYGLASIWARRFRVMGLTPLQTAFGQVTASSLILCLPVLAFAVQHDFALPGGTVLAAMLGLAVLSTALAYLLFFQILASAGSTAVSLVTFLIPPSAILLGVIFLDETLAPRHLAGLGLIFLGLWAIGRKAGTAGNARGD